MSAVKVKLHLSHYHLSKLQKMTVFWRRTLQHFLASVHENVGHVPASAIGHCEGFDAPFGWLLGHILLGSETPSDTNHRIMQGKVLLRVVIGLKLDEDK